MVGAKIAAQEMARSSVGAEHFQPPVCEVEQFLHAALDGQRILELGRAAGFRQTRARLPRAPRCEKMAGGQVALGGR